MASEVPSRDKIALVANGTVDLECGSTVNTLERQKQVDFSDIPFAAATQLLARKDGGIREVEDLGGKTIALPLATTPERLIRCILEQKKLDVRIIPVRDNAEGFLALATGRADAYATDNILLYGLRHTARTPDRRSSLPMPWPVAMSTLPISASSRQLRYPRPMLCRLVTRYHVSKSPTLTPTWMACRSTTPSAIRLERSPPKWTPVRRKRAR